MTERVAKRSSRTAGPRPLRPTDVFRDARQLTEVDAFFARSRPKGAVTISPWRWPAMIGQGGALAFLLGCSEVHADREHRRHVELFARAWSKTAFSRRPERFRVVETSEAELPFVLPVDASGYSHHTVETPGGRAFVDNYPSTRRVLLGAMTAGRNLRGLLMLTGAIFDETSPPSKLRTLTDRTTSRSRPAPLAETMRLGAQRGAFAATPTVLNRLVENGIPKSLAAPLWSGQLLDARDGNAAIDWERVVELCDAAAGDDPAELWRSPCAKGGPVDRMAARYRATRGFEKRLASAVTKLKATPARRRVQPPSGALGPASKKTLRRLVGLPKAGDCTLAQEVQQVRYDQGMVAFKRLLDAFVKSVPAREVEPALAFIFQEVEHSH